MAKIVVLKEKSKRMKNKKPHSCEVTSVELFEESAGQMDGEARTVSSSPRYSFPSSAGDMTDHVFILPFAKIRVNI